MKIIEVRISGDINIKSQWPGHGWKARGTATLWSVFSRGPTTTNGRKTTATSVILDFCQFLSEAAFSSMNSFSEKLIQSILRGEFSLQLPGQILFRQISSLPLWLRIDHKQITIHCVQLRSPDREQKTNCKRLAIQPDFGRVEE